MVVKEKFLFIDLKSSDRRFKHLKETRPRIGKTKPLSAVCTFQQWFVGTKYSTELLLSYIYTYIKAINKCPCYDKSNIIPFRLQYFHLKQIYSHRKTCKIDILSTSMKTIYAHAQSWFFFPSSHIRAIYNIWLFKQSGAVIYSFFFIADKKKSIVAKISIPISWKLSFPTLFHFNLKGWLGLRFLLKLIE